MRRDFFLNASAAVIATCATVLTGTVVWRAFSPAHPELPQTLPLVPDWERYASQGNWFGTRNSAIVIVEFSDFQCPVCRETAPLLRAVLAEHPDEIAVVYRHYPLQRVHPHAIDASLASECAAEQGRFEAFHDALFESQHEIGTAKWEEFAQRSKVPELDEFGRCVAEGRYRSRVDDDIAAAVALGVRGTPTLLINEYRFDGLPPKHVLDAAVRRLLEPPS